MPNQITMPAGNPQTKTNNNPLPTLCRNCGYGLIRYRCCIDDTLCCGCCKCEKTTAHPMPAGDTVFTDTPASNHKLAVLDIYEITDIHSNLKCACTGIHHAINALSLAQHATHTHQIQSLISIAIDSLVANNGVLDWEAERLGNVLELKGDSHDN